MMAFIELGSLGVRVSGAAFVAVCIALGFMVAWGLYRAH